MSPAPEPATTGHAPHRTRQRTVAPPWLALLAGPLSFGITGPALVLGDIARDLGVSVAGATSVVTTFGWGIAVGTPLAGVLVARRGTRQALAAFALLVAAGSAVVGTMPALAALVTGAALQALGAAGLTVAALTLARSPAAMGTITASLAVFGSVAPLVGTEIGTALGWQVTLVLPVLALLALPAALRATPPAAGSPPDRFDAGGALLLVAWVTGLVLIPQRPALAGATALVLTVPLVAHLRRRPHGFVPAVLMRTPRFLLATALAFGLAVVNFGIVYASPRLLADLTGWTNTQLGVAMLVPYLVGGATSWFLVTASPRLSFPALATVLVAGAAAALVCAVTGSRVTALVFAAMVFGSLTASTGQGALGLRAGEAVPAAVRPTAMGLFTLWYLLGAAFGPTIAALTAT